MGYITDFSGEIRIVPPLPWSAVKDSPWRPVTPGDGEL